MPSGRHTSCKTAFGVFFKLNSFQTRLTSVNEDDKLMTAVAWKPNGEKCPLTNKNGNGIWIWYYDDGMEGGR